MKNKTRKFIRSAPFITAALAVLGALTLAGVLLLPNANTADAQGVGPAITVSATDVSTAGNKKITVKWQAPTAVSDALAVTQYQVRYKLAAAGDSDYSAWMNAGGFQARQYVITGLTNNSAYNVQVRALYSDGDASPAVASDPASLTPAPTVPGKVTGITLRQASNAMGGSDGVVGTGGDDTYTVVVSWTPPADDGGSDIVGYVVQVGTLSTATPPVFTETDTPGAFTTARAFADLEEMTDHFSIDTSDTVVLEANEVVRVIAINDASDGDNTDLEAADFTAEVVATSGEVSMGFSPSASVSLSTLDFDAMVTDVDSTSGSAGVNIRVEVKDLTAGLPPGSSIVVYLEDDYVVPSSIDSKAVHFSVTGAHSRMGDFSRGLVIPDIAPTVKTGAYVNADKKDYSIRVRVPNFCTDGAQCGPESGQDLALVLTTAAGIKNPSEHGTHSTYVDVLGPVDELKSASVIRGMDKVNFNTVAKISLSSVDGSRGDEITVTGSGFNNGISAGVYVYAAGTRAKLEYMAAAAWEMLDCAGMKRAAGSDSNRYCFHYDLNPTAMTFTLNTSAGMRGGHADFMALSMAEKQKYSKAAIGRMACQVIMQRGTRAGIGTVGSDDKVSVSFEVTVPTFQPGNGNFICMIDGEGRMSHLDIEDFSLDPSIRVSPTTANVGDTVTIFAEDFEPNTAGTPIQLASRNVGANTPATGSDGSGTQTFKIPGWAEGTLRVDAWGENTKITVIGSSLTISKSEALPNELLTISGTGFSTGDGNHIDAAMVTIDGVPLQIHKDSVDQNSRIDVSSSGQFVATVVLWPADTMGSNPTLTAGVRTIKVEDNKEFSGSVKVTIPAPSIMVTPGAAGPRDVITISGENWPVDNIEGAAPPTVSIEVDDGRARTYSALPDSAGRFFVEHRVSSAVSIPSTNRVTATIGSDIVKVATFEVPAAVIEITPTSGQPGDSLSLSVDKMPVYAAVDSIEIAGRDVMPVGNFSTDRTGSVTVDGVIIPGLDPGTYSVLMNIDGTVTIGSLDVLPEGPVGSETPVNNALAPLGDSLVAVFHFDNVSKTWTFYDPRPEFADLNTLTDLVDGEPYWVLISSDVADVVLNSKSRSFTCRGGNCWNPIIW